MRRWSGEEGGRRDGGRREGGRGGCGIEGFCKDSLLGTKMLRTPLLMKLGWRSGRPLKWDASRLKLRTLTSHPAAFPGVPLKTAPPAKSCPLGVLSGVGPHPPPHPPPRIAIWALCFFRAASLDGFTLAPRRAARLGEPPPVRRAMGPCFRATTELSPMQVFTSKHKNCIDDMAYFPLVAHRFREDWLVKKCNTSSVKKFGMFFKLLFMRDGITFPAMASKEYLELVCASPEDKACKQQHRGVVRRFASWWEDGGGNKLWRDRATVSADLWPKFGDKGSWNLMGPRTPTSRTASPAPASPALTARPPPTPQTTRRPPPTPPPPTPSSTDSSDSSDSELSDSPKNTSGAAEAPPSPPGPPAPSAPPARAAPAGSGRPRSQDPAQSPAYKLLHDDLRHLGAEFASIKMGLMKEVFSSEERFQVWRRAWPRVKMSRQEMQANLEHLENLYGITEEMKEKYYKFGQMAVARRLVYPSIMCDNQRPAQPPPSSALAGPPGPSKLKKRKNDATSSSADVSKKKRSVSWIDGLQAGDEKGPTLEQKWSVFSLKGCEPLWYAQPGSRVPCDRCPAYVPSTVGTLVPIASRSQFACEVFLCSQCSAPTAAAQ